jgi:hypothetical protein
MAINDYDTLSLEDAIAFCCRRHESLRDGEVKFISGLHPSRKRPMSASEDARLLGILRRLRQSNLLDGLTQPE